MGIPLYYYACSLLCAIILYYTIFKKTVNKIVPPLRCKPTKVLTKPTGNCYLITGAHGLLGSHLVEALLARGETNIRIIDTCESDLFMPERKLGHIIFYNLSILDYNTIEPVFNKVDTVFHCAALVDFWSRLSFQYDLIYLINVTGTKNIIKACEKHKIKNLLVASSTAVAITYDNLNWNNVSEAQIEESFNKLNNDKIKHLNWYGITKYEAEQLVIKANNDNLHTISLRAHGLYGPRDQHMQAIYCKQCPCLARENYKQDFLYVENFVHAFLCAESKLNDKNECNKVSGQSYFITGKDNMGYYDFVKLNAKLFNTKIIMFEHMATILAYISEFITYISYGYVSTGPLKVLTPPVLTLARAKITFNGDKARKLLDYNSPYTIEQGVELGVKYFKQYHKIK